MEDEAAENWRLILSPAGGEWSGRARYAAAMYFFKAGEMSAEVLEIYRICSRLDGEDAVDALKAYRMGSEWIEKVEGMRAALEQELPPSGLPAISPSRGEIDSSRPLCPNRSVCDEAGECSQPISPLEGEMAGRPEGGEP